MAGSEPDPPDESPGAPPAATPAEAEADAPPEPPAQAGPTDLASGAPVGGTGRGAAPRRRPRLAPVPPSAARRAGRAAVLLAALTLGGCGMLGWLEQRMLYFPDPWGPWHVEGTVVDGVRVEPHAVPLPEGGALHAWRVTRAAPRPDEGPAPWALLWFHGNAGNVTNRLPMARDLIRGLEALGEPVDVFLPDYRGYGKSPGTPSEAGLYEDALASWAYVTEALGVPPARVVVLGKSLGGGPAAELATRVTPGGLILQSTFTSIPDMAARVLPIVPRGLVRTQFATIDKVGRVACPLLVVHSPQDEVIPYAMGRALFDAAPGPKQFHEVTGAGHNETWLVGGERYLRSLAAFLAACRAGPAAGGGPAGAAGPAPPPAGG